MPRLILPIRRKFGDSVRYFLFNAHGDVVCITNGYGKLMKRYSYDAFGNEEKPLAGDTNLFRYCGEIFDKETGTYYLRARYYDPAIGRFTQQDSVLYTTRILASGHEYVDPLSLNLYTYRDMKKLVKGTGLEVHHLVEKRFAKTLGLNENDILSIAISGSDHQKITQAFRKAIGYSNEKNKDWTTSNATADIIWEKIVEVYKNNGMEKYLSLLKQFLLNNAKNVGEITNWHGID